MSKQFIVRPESKNDYRQVEYVTREAFWNVYKPGCDEHYMAHVLRCHPDFVQELDFVLELDGQVVGSVMYSRSKLIDEAGNVKNILSFGPIAVLPEHQRQGGSRLLLEHSFEKAKELGYDCIVIFGNPENYVSRGLVSCKRHNICLEGGIFPTPLLVKTLTEDALDGRRWYFHESDIGTLLHPDKVQEFDESFEAKEKSWQPSQEQFYILSHSRLR